MGRASRRKQERRFQQAAQEFQSGHKPVGVFINDQTTGTQTVLTAQGHEFSPRIHDLPEKVRGQHRYIVHVGYRISEELAAKAQAGEEKVLMDMENIVSFGMGCWDCEQPYQECVGRTCPAPAQEI